MHVSIPLSEYVPALPWFCICFPQKIALLSRNICNRETKLCYIEFIKLDKEPLEKACFEIKIHQNTLFL